MKKAFFVRLSDRQTDDQRETQQSKEAAMQREDSNHTMDFEAAQQHWDDLSGFLYRLERLAQEPDVRAFVAFRNPKPGDHILNLGADLQSDIISAVQGCKGQDIASQWLLTEGKKPLRAASLMKEKN
ncbi:hypothetical protein MMC11_007726 [Xylographa trunciseda]|nr:hypothetical protein [Xylographa trunciseda]